jgi:hypothetical protein
MKSAVIYLFKDKRVLAPAVLTEAVMPVADSKLAGGENILQFSGGKRMNGAPETDKLNGHANRAGDRGLPRLARLLGELDDQRINRAQRINKSERKLSVVRS